MKRRIRFLTAFLAVLLSVLTPLAAMAAEKANRQLYKPMDAVVVFDVSGSMKKSDADRLVPDAIRTFSNMMPAADGRLGIVSFNEEGKALTVKNGSPALLELKELQNVEDVHKMVEQVAYDGDTAMGNGLQSAVALLQGSSSVDTNKAIIVFSDGVDDLTSQLKLQEAQDNLTDAVQWASVNNCKIYTVAFNYKLSDGKDSLPGEGIAKLQKIAGITGGSFSEVHELEEIEQEYIKILAEICELNYEEVNEIPGDGGHYEWKIPVNEGVVEMNVRIAEASADALTDGSVQLLDPDGKKIPLENGDSVRVDAEQHSANIKVLDPYKGKNGEYTLTLDGIRGNNIKIGMLNHYAIGIEAGYELPAGNPAGTAFAGDNVGITVKLLDAAGNNAPEGLYQSVEKAEAKVTAKDDAQKYPQPVQLKYEDGVLKGSFTHDGKSAVDITATVSSPEFSKEITIAGPGDGNRPLEFGGKPIENQKLDVKKQVVIENISRYATDPENDPITVSIADVENASIADVTVDQANDQIVIKGLKWGSTIVTVRFTDPQKNEVTTTFSVKVKDPLLILLLTLIPVLIGLGVALALFLIGRGTRRITGSFTVSGLAYVDNGKRTIVGKGTTMKAGTVCRGTQTTLQRVMKKYAADTCTMQTTTNEQYDMLQEVFLQNSRSRLNVALGDVMLTGTVLGKRGFVLKVPKGRQIQIANQPAGSAVKMKVEGNATLPVKIALGSGTELSFTLSYAQYSRAGGGLGGEL